MKSLRNHFLVAAPTLLDPNFFRAIVWLVEHTEEGALGVVVNRPTETTVREAWEQVGALECRQEGLLYFGGPCQNLVTAAHDETDLANIVMSDGLCFTQEPEKLERIAAGGVSPAKFFVGYAGWGSGQLEAELDEGSWLVTPAQRAQLFEADETLWENLVCRASSGQMLSLLNIKHVPEDPSMN